MMTDDLMRELATERQREYLDAVAEHGSGRKAAEALGVHYSVLNRSMESLRKRANQRDRQPHLTGVPEGYRIKGTSTLYGPDGEVKLQWNKTDTDREKQLELMREAIGDMNEAVAPVEPRTWARDTSAEPGQLTVYPVGDLHMGMLSWAKETGGDWDLKIAEETMNRATAYLMDRASPTAGALVPLLGDFFHYDSMVPETPTSHNQLDSDTRPQKMIRAGTRVARVTIERALDKHEWVYVIVEIGNHDLLNSVWLAETLNLLYENEPRVTVDTSPARCHYFSFGTTLIGTHHGDLIKMEQLPLIMAHDRPQEWGATAYRYWLTGHVHHSKTKQFATLNQDFTGCSVESFRVLPPGDAWHAGKGYRAARGMTAITIDKRHGEVARTYFNPSMMLDDARGESDDGTA